MICRESKFTEAVRSMPKLKHWPDDNQEFDIKKSEVVKWLVEQPEVMDFVFFAVKGKKLIRFDKESSTWKGCGGESIQWTGSNKGSVIKFIEGSGVLVEKLTCSDDKKKSLIINGTLLVEKGDWLIASSSDPVAFKVVPDAEHLPEQVESEEVEQ